MSELPRRKMGRTGMQPKALGMGAAFVNHVDEAETIATVERALELGIDFFDTYAGANEERWGHALSGVDRTSYYMQAKSAPIQNAQRISRPIARDGASNKAYKPCASTTSIQYWSTIHPISSTPWALAGPSTSCRR